MPEIVKPSTLSTSLLSKISRGVPLTREEHLEADEYIRLRESVVTLRTELPHLYGWKWYPWARDFYESRSKIHLLCAANQISKSSTQIRKCITWATDQQLWPALWNHPPKQFWYLYPSSDVATAEWLTKWSQFMPQGSRATDPVYGFTPEWDKKKIKAIHFNSGVVVYFKTYAQEVKNLQTGTVDALFCDEELPVEHYDELIFRISSSNGYFNMVFTATLGQEFWRQVMEPMEHEEPRLPEARKQCVSLYECQEYEDGTKTHWTDERIRGVIARCKDEQEVLRRVWGRFVYGGEGLKYPQFEIKKHMRAPHPLPSSWLIYAGVDIGSGGTNHKSAICFVGVSPDFRQGRVFLGWRGDEGITTAGDTLEKYNALVSIYRLKVTQCFYDQNCKDFDTIQSRHGGSFEKADKSHVRGEEIINTLFKNGMMLIYDEPELRKLATELCSLRQDQSKNKAKDDLTDAFRYAVTRIPWDWSQLGQEAPVIEKTVSSDPDAGLTEEQKYIKREVEERRSHMQPSGGEEDGYEEEFAFWDSLS